MLPTFALIAVVRLVDGWDLTDAIGLPLGLAATLVYVFVPRLPRWPVGSWRVWPLLSVVPLALIVVALVLHPPHGEDLGFAAVVVCCALIFVLYALSKLVRWDTHSRTAVRTRLRARTAVLVTAAVLAAGLETAAVAGGGWLPWVVPVPALIALGFLVVWRADVEGTAWMLAEPRTTITAATFDETPGAVRAWAVLPGGVPARVGFDDCPPEVLADLRARRRLEVAGAPFDGVCVAVVGDVFAVAEVWPRRQRQPSTPPGTGAPGS